METKEIKWTDEQKQVIEETGKNMLVSASAGSGKTTVMIEKIIRLMIKERTPISNFLVVTFTRTSASDMKKKLIDKLMEKEIDEFLLEQIEMVETSDISTLHVFCSRLIQTYFYEVDIDPNFCVIDEIQSSMIKERAISKLFEQKERAGDEDFFELFEIFQKKRSDSALKTAIFKFSEFLKSIIHGNEWFEQVLKSSYEPNLEKNECAKAINIYVAGQAKQLAENAIKLADKCLKLNEEKAYQYFVDVENMFRLVNFRNTYAVNAKNLFEIKFGTAPKVDAKNEQLKAEISSFLTSSKKQLKDLTENMISPDERSLKVGIVQAKEHLEKLFNLTKEFDREYDKLKRDAGLLDFNDLEINALKILSNTAIQNAVRAKYKYVFVDEYQDINAVQEEIIARVSSENNRFMVGDIKQSIYAFRLCDPQIFLGTLKKYSSKSSDSRVIKLNANFRSDKKILKFVDRVFSGVMTEEFGGTDYKKDAQFVAGESNLDKPKSVNLCFIDSPSVSAEKPKAKGVYSVKEHFEETSEDTAKIIAEANLVASKIEELTDKTKENSMDRSDIAILISARNSKISKFVSVLKSYGINVSSGEKYDLMKKPYIEEIVNFVTLCVGHNDDILMFKVLKSKLFNFSNSELVKIRELDFGARFFDLALNASIDENSDIKAKLENFREKLQKFSALSKMLILSDFVRQIVEEFKLEEINLATEKGESVVQDIKRFVLALPNVSPTEFVLEYKNYAHQIDSELAGDTVKMMTIHASKGIEFKAVFLVNLDNQINLKSTYGSLLFSKDFGAGLDYFDFETRTKQETIPISAIRICEKRKIVEEQQRVLYVALTRAVEKLFVICSKDKEKLEETFAPHPRSFLNWFEPIISSEMIGKHDENINFECYDLADLLHSETKKNRQLILTPTGNEVKPFVYGFSKWTTIPLKTSVSKLLKQEFEDENQNYEEKFLSNEHTNSSAERGTAYHKIMQKLDLKNMHNIDEQIDAAMSELSLDEAKLVKKSAIKSLLEMPFFSSIKPDDVVLQEREFIAKVPCEIQDKNCEMTDNFILQGVVDLVVLSKDEITLLDYKTGNISDEKIKKYSFQLNLYADVIERAFGKKVTQKLIAFIDLQKLVEI
jgi:ATP-dependent helicase/nuclease subunit A